MGGNRSGVGGGGAAAAAAAAEEGAWKGLNGGELNEHNPAAQGKIATAPTASPIARFLPLN